MNITNIVIWSVLAFLFLPIVFWWIGMGWAYVKNKRLFGKKKLGEIKNSTFVKILKENSIRCITLRDMQGAIAFSYLHLIPFKICFVSPIIGKFNDLAQEYIAYHEIFHFKPKKYGGTYMDCCNETLASIYAKKEFLKHHTTGELERALYNLAMTSEISGGVSIKALLENDFDEVVMQ